MTPDDLTPPKLNRRAVLAGLTGAGVGALTVGGLYLTAQKKPVVETAKARPAPPLKSWPSLDDLGEQMVAAKLTPGLSLSVMHDGVMFYSRGFGVARLDNGEAVTPQTGFRIASITKHFAASAILLLAEAGKLSVDDTLAKYVPEFPNAGDITLRQMMSHTSGLNDYINGQSMVILTEAQQRNYSAPELIDIMSRRRPILRHQPGQTWAYSNTGFTLLGIVVERVSGASLPDFVAERLAKPAGLTRTAIDKTCNSIAGCEGYRPNYRAEQKFDLIRPISPSFAGGAGAIRSTTEDLCLWHHALIDGKVIKPDSLTAMLSPALLKDGSPAIEKRGKDEMNYGFGLALGHEGPIRFASHGGRINGFTGHLRSFPDQKLTVAILYNSDGGGAPGFKAAQRGLRVQSTTLAMQELGIEPATGESADGAG
ncbi:alkaline D-peptidase-like protein [Asticcacaulis biprosthecium C19]|uniref:Alkaline D-peptidase-like protein n=1 Tax=Asticcacaulis biprosthecium C19 TaxID=715226 RepID=F4QPE8_9CAUL|nr:serine hydrolase domain-containing protein [Asticcacaulis biprosthecium]EGF91206.1 alkaline D-peptidase-like protein [Asticcacaulis biprosthecium C19]